jgi:hypothetical protein
MVEAIDPKACSERFTIYLDAEDKPVQRTLGEMTSGEVMQAIRWHIDECSRLEIEGAPAAVAIAAAIEGWRDPKVPDLTAGELEAASMALQRCAELSAAYERLTRLVRAALPRRSDQLPLADAVRLYWRTTCQFATGAWRTRHDSNVRPPPSDGDC